MIGPFIIKCKIILKNNNWVTGEKTSTRSTSIRGSPGGGVADRGVASYRLFL